MTRGALAGAVVSVAKGMYAMIAAGTYQDVGVITPLYHIAAPIIGLDPMGASMTADGSTSTRGPPRSDC